MTRRKRRVIFYVLFALFLLIGALVVLYAQGWRLDMKTWRLEKVGAIFVRSFPTDATITLDGVPAPNQSGFLSRGTLISNLFPRSYDLALAKDGYADWHENVEAFPSLVTELKYAVLVPQISTIVATGSIKTFSLVSREMVTQMKNGDIGWRGKTVGRGDIVSEGTDPGTIIIKNSVSGKYSLYSFTKSTSTDLSAGLVNDGVDPGGITSIAIDPHDAANILVSSIHRVWMFGPADHAIVSLERAPTGTMVGSFPVSSPSLIAWTRLKGASDTSAVVLYDKFSKMVTVSSSTIPGESAATKWIKDGLLGVLQMNGSLYTYDTGTQEFHKLADDVQNFYVTDDGTALAALEHRSMEIFPFTDALTYRRFNLPDIAAAKNVIWYKDLSHLFVEYPDYVALLDLQDLGLRNFKTVAQGTMPFYAPQENALYLIDPRGTLVKFNFAN
jgi:hypothetical protein